PRADQPPAQWFGHRFVISPNAQSACPRICGTRGARGRTSAGRYPLAQPWVGSSMFSLTVIATTGERFSDFAPYVASVNDAGTVAFQAELRGGGTGVFTSSGEAVAEVAGPALLAGVTSHPDLNGAGD